MTEQLSQLKSFSHLSLLTGSSNGEKIYRLLYDTSTRYFVINNKRSQSYQLLEADGSVISDDRIDPLYDKIRAYERLFGKSLVKEKLHHMLRINEVEFLLGELNMNRPDLEQRIFDRLTQFVRQQERKPFYDPLFLPKLLAHNDFVSNYLQTNIGYPDGTDNYFNRMKIMIEQIAERTSYVDVPSYFDIIRTLILYVRNQGIESQNIIISGYNCYCVLQGGMNSLSEPDFLPKTLSYLSPETATVVSVDNIMIAKLIKIYNSIVEE